MPFTKLNDTSIHYQISGTGDVPLVLVHGSWGSLHNWDLVLTALAKQFQVITSDRRGHGKSTCPEGQGSVRDDVIDLAELIEETGVGPAYVAGNSFGASIALRLACTRPDLVRGISLHEPPLFSLVAGRPDSAEHLGELMTAIMAVAEKLQKGKNAEAVDEFMAAALAPDEWEQLPQDFKDTAIEVAPTFLDEITDPDALVFDLDWLDGLDKPVQLSRGERSPKQYGPVLDILAAALPQAAEVTYAGLGHLPHITSPSTYVETLSTFVKQCERSV